MATFTALAIFFVSFAGLFFVIGKKIPLLLTFPSNGGLGIADLKKRVKERLQGFHLVKLVSSPEIFLQTLLSKVRVYALRLETKMSDWLIRLRKKSQQEKSQEETKKFASNFWDKLKKK